MEINVIGKAHLSGTSKKSGRDYDFIRVHYVGRAHGVVGEAALTMVLDPGLYSYNSIVVPVQYTVEFDSRGYPVEFTPCGK